jgi:hypothetical protein
LSGYGRQIVFTASIGVVIAVALGVGVYYLQPQLSSASPTAPATGTFQGVVICSGNDECARTTNATFGLELQLSINSTEFTPGQAMAIAIGEYNTLSRVNNVTTANISPIQNLSINGCTPEPFGIAIFKGHYSIANISKGSSLPLFPFTSCPPPSTNYGMFPPQYYLFQPKSFYATIVSQPQVTVTNDATTTISETYSQQAVADNIVLRGYCCSQTQVSTNSASDNSTQSNSGYTQVPVPFTTGNYTLAGGDEWGQFVLLYFEVS